MVETLEQYIRDFHKKNRSCESSGETDMNYSFIIKKFQQWLIPIAHIETEGEPKLSHELLSDFVNYLARHYSDETVRVARKVMNVFAQWASDQGLLPPVATVIVPETREGKLHNNDILSLFEMASPQG